MYFWFYCKEEMSFLLKMFVYTCHLGVPKIEIHTTQVDFHKQVSLLFKKKCFNPKLN